MGLENELIMSIPAQFFCKCAEGSVCQVTLQIVERIYFLVAWVSQPEHFMTIFKVRTWVMMKGKVKLHL